MSPLPPGSGHDYPALLERWLSLAQNHALDLQSLCEVRGYPVLALQNEAAARGAAGGLYVSAGVHGDECAPVWALLEWAESALSALTDTPIVLFPCLNPVGLMENTRRDADGLDLNRHFGTADHYLIGPWQRFLQGRRFERSLHLHEDYDAMGIYLYELTRGTPCGEPYLEACESLIPRERAERIDGNPFVRGLFAHSGDLEAHVADHLGGGYPEAIQLFLHHSKVSYTFETPSERDLNLRIAAQRAFLEVATA